MEENKSNFEKLKENISELIRAYKKLREEKDLLKIELEETKNRLSLLQKEYIDLKSDNDELKVANAMMGGKEHKRLMKLRVNKLIKEVDACIVQLKN